MSATTTWGACVTKLNSIGKKVSARSRIKIGCTCNAADASYFLALR